jgi:hypothetical protein
MDLKFKEYYQDNQQKSGIQYPKPLTGAGIGGYLGYAFGGPVGGLAGAAAGYGLGKLAGPQAMHDNPNDWLYVRGPDGQVYREPKRPTEITSIEQALKLNNDPSHPYHYEQDDKGKWTAIKKSPYQQKRWQSFGKN